MVTVEVIDAPDLPLFLKSNLVSSSFSLYTHILTEPFISVFCELPDNVKRYSRVFLDEEKDKINRYAARRLYMCGYRQLYFVRKLHTKLIVTNKFVVLGSANLSERAITQNYEVVVVIWANPWSIRGLRNVLTRIEKRAIRIRPNEINVG